MALDILLRDIERILGEIQSDKVTVRTKALDLLQQTFDNRSSEVSRVLTGGQDVSWKGVYMSLHEALKAQAARLDDARCTAATRNRSGDYSTAIMKCINLANSKTQNIVYDVILETAFQAFADVSMRKHYGLCYVQIIRKHVLDSRRNLAAVKIHQWSRKCPAFLMVILLLLNIEMNHRRTAIVFVRIDREKRNSEIDFAGMFSTSDAVRHRIYAFVHRFASISVKCCGHRSPGTSDKGTTPSRVDGVRIHEKRESTTLFQLSLHIPLISPFPPIPAGIEPSSCNLQIQRRGFD